MATSNSAQAQTQSELQMWEDGVDEVTNAVQLEEIEITIEPEALLVYLTVASIRFNKSLCSIEGKKYPKQPRACASGFERWKYMTEWPRSWNPSASL